MSRTDRYLSESSRSLVFERERERVRERERERERERVVGFLFRATLFTRSLGSLSRKSDLALAKPMPAELWLKTATCPDLAERECHSAEWEGNFLRMFELRHIGLNLTVTQRAGESFSALLRKRSPN